MSPASSAASAEGSPPGSATTFAVNPCVLNVSSARADQIGRKLKVGAPRPIRTTCCATARFGSNASATPMTAALVKPIARMIVSMFPLDVDRTGARQGTPAQQPALEPAGENIRDGDEGQQDDDAREH